MSASSGTRRSESGGRDVAETFVDKQVRLVLEKQTREIANVVKERVPAGVGFALFLFDFGADGNIGYVSTAQRDDMIRLIEEWLTKVK